MPSPTGTWPTFERPVTRSPHALSSVASTTAMATNSMISTTMTPMIFSTVL